MRSSHSDKSTGYHGRVALAVVCLFAFTPPLWADPVLSQTVLQISGGRYAGSFVNDDREQSFFAFGAGLELNLFTEFFAGGTFHFDQGTTRFMVDPSVTFDAPFFGTIRIGTQQLDGTAEVPFRLTGAFMAPLTRWSPPGDREPGAFVEVNPFPFDFSGAISGRDLDGQAFSFGLEGRGTGFGVYIYQGNDVDLRRIGPFFAFDGMDRHKQAGSCYQQQP